MSSQQENEDKIIIKYILELKNEEKRLESLKNLYTYVKYTKKREEITKEKKYEKNKNLTELKENSFVIEKTSNKEKKENDETNKKILELTQRLEKTEKEIIIIILKS